MPQVRGIIFDLDGTLVDSRLDFDAMRRDMGLPVGVPILEALSKIEEGPPRDLMLSILRDHELRGADEAVLMDGVTDFLSHIQDRSIVTAILTRNSRECTERTLQRLNLNFSQVITREDAPPKPDPTGVKMIAEQWGLPAQDIIVIGDYLYDLQAGRRAGMRSVLYAPDERPHYADEADYVLQHFGVAAELLERIQAHNP